MRVRWVTARVGAGTSGARERFRPIDLATVTRQVLDTRHDEVCGRGITITASLKPAQTLGDPRLIEALVANLVDNAVGHNITGGSVEIRTSTDDGLAHLDVTNTGMPVPPEAIERIFQRFRRIHADRTRSDGGLGLGLSIAQAIADTHDATITARPRTEEGLEIRISFTPPDNENAIDPARQHVGFHAGSSGDRSA